MHRWRKEIEKRYVAKVAVLLSVIAILVPLLITKCVTRVWGSLYLHTGIEWIAPLGKSIDVLALGSSHIVSAFSPQELYNNYQITSYNLGCEQQNLVVSYYWLKEALQYQSPKTVILDVYMLFHYELGEGGGLNTSEACMRKALDYMRWSKVKVEAVETICALDVEQSALSYYLPNIRFHTRWTSLNENDFNFEEMSEHYELKGFSALSGRAVAMKKYEPFEAEQA